MGLSCHKINDFTVYINNSIAVVKTHMQKDYIIPADRLTCIACFSPISQSILNRFSRNFTRTIFNSRVRPFDM